MMPGNRGEFIPKDIHVECPSVINLSSGVIQMQLVTTNVAGAVALANGVSIKNIVSEGMVSIKNMKDLGKRFDEVTIAHILHVAGQKHFSTGGKGDTSALQDWVCQVYVNNATYGKAIIKAVNEMLGMSFRVHYKDDDDEGKGAECTVTLKDNRKIAAIIEALPEKLASAYKNGITQDVTGHYNKLKVPKKRSSAKATGPVEDGAVETKSGVDVAVEGTALANLLSATAADADAQAALAEISDDLAEVLNELLHMDKAQRNSIMFGLKQKIQSIKAKLGKDLAAA